MALVINEKRMETAGFVRFHLGDVIRDLDMHLHLSHLQQQFLDLPIDQYAPETNRYRRYSRAIIHPWNHKIEWLPEYVAGGKKVSEYYQGKFNGEYMEEYRAFPPLTDAAKTNPLLLRILQYDFKHTFWSQRETILPIHIGVHFVKMVVDDHSKEAVASPNHIHRDGEPFTFAHLVTYHNIAGGENVIATVEATGETYDKLDESLVLDRFTLTEPLDSYGVCDSKVSHYVSPVRKGSGTQPAERGMLLIDYTPLVIDLN